MRPSRFAVLSAVMVVAGPATAQIEPPVFQTDVISQADIATFQVGLKKIRERGMMVFSTPMTEEIGYGDGPINPLDTVSPGGRPTLQGNGLHLRVNGLDAQTCMECHAVVSNLTVPFTFGVGGVAGSNANVIFQPTAIDVADAAQAGEASMDGRFINPPFLFGSGGIERVGKEMTAELQKLKGAAFASPGQPVALVTKGVSFGSIVYRNGNFDTSAVEGIDDDLVVRPFGRKGEFATVRGFDVDAMRFHFGMEPVEAVGPGDADGDGVADELSIGDLSALSIFGTNLDAPRVDPPTPASVAGELLFDSVGCTTCHVPFLDTESTFLTYSYPEVDEDPFANIFYRADLRKAPGLKKSPATQGVRVPLFSDLKRHDMGPGLKESAGSDLDAFFITARLWGVADTAPYLHDGRAHTLKDAILLHGGEAAPVRQAFENLPNAGQEAIVKFLLTLRTPKSPASDILP